MMYFSFLRGINVGGKNLIQMAELKSLCEEMGLKNVRTYIQSGNLIFESELDASILIQNIEKLIHQHYGFNVPVQVIERSELELIAKQNPFIPKCDIGSLHLTLLEAEADTNLINAIGVDANSDDEFAIKERAIYVHCPNGYGRTKLNNNFFEAKLKTKATTRNWKTVLKLISLAH